MKSRIVFAPLVLFAVSFAARAAGDGEALAVLSAVNSHEIATAALAKDKGVSAAVKDYAQKMDTDHSANQRESEALAAANGLAPQKTDAVKALETKSAAEREKLAAMSGAQFEAAYIDAMVKDHAEVLAKLDKELLPAAQNPALKAHLAKTREHVAHHLEAAKALDAQPATARAD